MNAFSASDAALAGVSLIRRYWRILLGWAGFNLIALVMLIVLTVVLSVATSGMTGGAREPTAVVAGVVVLVGSVFIEVVIAAGVFRLELRPEEPAFLHLRFGADEVRLVAVWLITLAGGWAIAGGAALLGQVLGAAGVWVELLALGLGVYLGLRFLLAAPISFVEGRIDFARSWRLTRGRVGALLGMNALSFALIALLLVTVFVVLGLIAVGTAGLDGVAGLFEGADALKEHPGVYLLQFAADVVLIPVLWALGLAPLAAAYRALAAPAEAV
jgi:hypothetical protein